MNYAGQYSVAALVATADRPRLLTHRALPSIGDQDTGTRTCAGRR